MRSGDLALLLAMGVFIAAVPLALVWWRGGRRLERLAWSTVFLTFDLIVFGGFTRLTDSGLGCPDWPGCFAQANPWAARASIAAAQAQAPGGAVSPFQAWVEMIHRFLAESVGFLLIVLLVAAWWNWMKRGRSPRLPMAALVLVLVQGAFGAFTVNMKLQPIIVTAHLLLALSLLALLTVNALATAGVRPLAVGSSTRALALAFAGMLAVQIFLGGWVSTNYAVLACPDFPTCQGRWWPDMDFAHGFQLWRALGRTAAGGYVSHEALTAIHFTHRLFALAVVLCALVLAWRLARTPGARRLGGALFALILLQAGTGIANVVWRWPLPVAVLHNAGAASLVLLLSVLNYRAWLAQDVPAAQASRPDSPIAVTPHAS